MKKYASFLIALIAVTLIIIGASSGGTVALFQKSATVCLECIGIG